MSFRPSRLERSHRKVDEIRNFVDSLTDLGESFTRRVKAWRRVVLMATGSVTSVIVSWHLRGLIHLVLR